MLTPLIRWAITRLAERIGLEPVTPAMLHGIQQAIQEEAFMAEVRAGLDDVKHGRLLSFEDVFGEHP